MYCRQGFPQLSQLSQPVSAIVLTLEFGQLRKFRNGNRHSENATGRPSGCRQPDGRHAVAAAPFGFG
jgi:hypothetical protein